MPFTVDRLAPVFAEREVLIEAPRERVWELLSGIDDWPRWQSGVSRARLEGALTVGTPFRFNAGGMRIRSALREVTAPNHIAWDGKALGLRARHGWYLYGHPRGTVVLTAESFDGPLARLLRPVLRRVLSQALNGGLTDLKREAETSNGE